MGCSPHPGFPIEVFLFSAEVNESIKPEDAGMCGSSNLPWNGRRSDSYSGMLVACSAASEA
jgi:hypothetical protein